MLSIDQLQLTIQSFDVDNKGGFNTTGNSSTSLESATQSETTSEDDNHNAGSEDDSHNSNDVESNANAIENALNSVISKHRLHYAGADSESEDDDDDDDDADNLQSFQRSLSYSEKREWATTAFLFPGLASYNAETQKVKKRIEDAANDHPFLGLPCDIQQNILSYLDDTSFRMMQQVSRSMRDLLMKASELNTTLWSQACVQRWPWLNEIPDDCDIDNYIHEMKSKVVLVDSLKLPTPLEFMPIDRASINYGLLVSLAASSLHKGKGFSKKAITTYYSKMEIDESKFLYTTSPAGVSLPRFRFIEKNVRAVADSNLNSNNDNETEHTTTLQFIGDIRVGSRCVTTKVPFFRPELIANNNTNNNNASGSENKNKVNLIRRIRNILRPLDCIVSKGIKKRTNTASRKSKDLSTLPYFWKPFVIPFTLTYDVTQNIKEMQLMPRLVKYFEITILPPRALPWEHQARERGEGDNVEQLSECVAIGVAEHTFPLSGRMPGWDSLSYGYHSDDGKAYHGNHDLSATNGHRRPEDIAYDSHPYSSTFGANDTVGCGIDYHNRSIFFTKNGEFLGHAFTDLPVDMLSSTSFYPVVGIDTNSPIHFNFGYKDPFVFNLTFYVLNNQKDILHQTLIPASDISSTKKDNKRYW